MYKPIEVSLADTRRFYKYKLDGEPEISFSLKGFEYGWIYHNHPWKKGEKVLDVGAAYSTLPIHIQKTFGCEVWVADDFGINSNEPFWTRHADPYEHIRQNPEVKYVLERLGDPGKSSLPNRYFDVIYSASALEHVPGFMTDAVWKHMDLLLAPGGELIHAIDIPLPSNGGIKKTVASILYDLSWDLIPYQFRKKHSLATAYSYACLCAKSLGTKKPKMGGLDVVKMVLDPEIVIDNLDAGFNRLTKDNLSNYRHQRIGSLLIHYKKE